MIDIGLTQMSGYGTVMTVMIIMFILGIAGLYISNKKDKEGVFLLSAIITIGAFTVAVVATGMLTDAGKENHTIAKEWIAYGHAERVCVNEFTRLGSDSPAIPIANQTVHMGVVDAVAFRKVEKGTSGVEGFFWEDGALMFDCYGAGYLVGIDSVEKQATDAGWLPHYAAWHDGQAPLDAVPSGDTPVGFESTDVNKVYTDCEDVIIDGIARVICTVVDES